MTVFEINGVPYGSTYKIMVGIARVAGEEGIKAIISTGYSRHPDKNMPENHVNIGGFFNKASHMALSKVISLDGYGSLLSTKRLIKEIKNSKADIIHLHNIHGAFLNFPVLFHFLKREKLAVVWTFHDCWNFTGLCPHFTMAKCDRWKIGCGECPQYKTIFSGYIADRSDVMWRKKKEWFTGLKRSVVVTPSHWLGELVEKSFFREYPVKVINNGIDLSIFTPKEGSRKKLGLPDDRYIILGVAMGWDERKGMDVFVSLAKKLDKRFMIILIGTNEECEKQLPQSILTVRRTQNQAELAEYYSAVDMLVNPTREDTFPTVNIEALACGTPVVNFKTGGCPEILDEKCGAIVPCDDVDALLARIIQEYERPSFDRDYCRKRALNYDMNDKFKEYVELYKQLLNNEVVL